MTPFSRVNPLWEYETTAIANHATVYATASRARPNKPAPPKGHDHWYHMPEQARVNPKVMAKLIRGVAPSSERRS